MRVTSYSGNVWTYFPASNTLYPEDRERDDGAGRPLEKVILPYTIDSLRTLCDDHLNEMILCLTENCNMRCRYCTYCDSFPQMRNFSSKTMSIETGKAAIEWLERHSRQSPAVNISFFGGEPLLEFSTVRLLYDYASSVFRGRSVTFMLTTNGTLFHKEFLSWLGGIDRFSVTITLNGPAEIHDQLRRYKGGGGTHKRIVDALPDLLAALKHDPGRLMIQCNYRDYRDVLKQHDYFSSNDIFKSVKIFYTGISLPPDTPNIKKELDVLPDYVDRMFEKRIRMSSVQHVSRLKRLSPVTLWETSLLPRFASEMNKSVPWSTIGHQGCCTPLFARGCIDVDGNISLCEKTENTPLLGNVNDNGIDWSVFDRLIRDCNQLFGLLHCESCPAVFYCKECYNHFYEKGKMKPVQQLKKICRGMCRIFHDELTWYCSLMETYPHLKILPVLDPAKQHIIELTEKTAMKAMEHEPMTGGSK